MSGVKIETLEDKWIISVDKTVTDIETIDDFFKRLKFEELAKKSNSGQNEINEI